LTQLEVSKARNKAAPSCIINLNIYFSKLINDAIDQPFSFS